MTSRASWGRARTDIFRSRQMCSRNWARMRCGWRARLARRQSTLDDFSDRYLAEYELRGNTARQKIAAAVHLVVAEHAGVVPDYFGTAGWWQVQDLSSFALLALVGMVRVAAERTGRPVTDLCAELAAAHDVSV